MVFFKSVLQHTPLQNHSLSPNSSKVRSHFSSTKFSVLEHRCLNRTLQVGEFQNFLFKSAVVGTIADHNLTKV